MSVDKIKNRLKQNSIKDTSWIERAKFRKENKEWLDVSFSIAVKMMSLLSENKKNNAYPSSQKELSEKMNCSAQYVSKLLKGEEKLNIETILKIQKSLKINIINNNFNSKKVEIIAQKDAIYKTPKASVVKNYRNLNGVISYNFSENRKISNHNVYSA
ncbi:helix-turn-helix domain-containing protein [Polaribacter sp. Hel1_85]|uniref:helix-turn-helix domain-containing protein n=1 Tax=Polaribacter sp. Hel1_85 TaxID=1250005 RepID=UPI00052D4649|nr:helix-turn-helix transcriptional regulator [Polaribacter sp. Hel1_85]KGL61807.1 helix-turn-helix domain protein [Polaribacter sp. Hel1_85]